ncbi:hypothetical protein FX983_00960 [Pseudomonas frederiksbergensis]|uniref:Uncharacterized protein n=1 Tax=Pseudomonas frederiksbergensis TaxID=104087 RepID=A0A6L5BWM8_9PSED|nr:hypothetical protein FX983_00960 [Pseudomonas frederiksbergensis]
MNKTRYLPLIVLAASLAACTAQNLSTTTSPEQRSDAVITNTPLPQAGVNQRPVTGVKTALLVAAHWQGDRELDMQQLYDSSFSANPRSLSDYLLKASGGKLILRGTTITARFTDPVPPEGYDGEMADAEKAARAQGYEPDQYDYFFVVHDDGVGGAQASMPGRDIVIREQPYAGHFLWAHEFGHNLGFSHEPKFAGGNGGTFDTYVNCPSNGTDVVAPLGCSVKRYGDSGDPVQGSRSIQSLFPANYRWYAGWLDASQMALISRSGLYRIGALGGPGPQLYLINRGSTSANDPEQIALEFRQPVPPYDNFAPTDNRVTGVWIRYTSMGNRVDNVQVDGTPLTASTDDPTLQPGRTLTDVSAKLKIHVCSADTKGATVAVAVNNEALPTCTPALNIAWVLKPSSQQQVGYRPFVSGTGPSGTTVIIETARPSGEREVVGTAIVRADGSWSAQIDHDLSPGPQRLSVHLTNPGSPDGIRLNSPLFTVINTPEQPVMQTPQPDQTTSRYPSFSGSGLPGATVNVELEANGLPIGLVASAVVDQDGHWSAQSSILFRRGSYTVTFYQRNGDKQSPGFATRTFQVVDAAPHNQ